MKLEKINAWAPSRLPPARAALGRLRLQPQQGNMDAEIDAFFAQAEAPRSLLGQLEAGAANLAVPLARCLTAQAAHFFAQHRYRAE